MKVCVLRRRSLWHPIVALLIFVGGFLWLPMLMPIAQAQTDPTPAQEKEVNGYDYTVQLGDNWSSVAARTGLTVADLKAANPRAAARSSGWLIQGERLFIPTATRMMTKTHVVQPGESWSVIAKAYGISTQLLKAANPGSIRYDEVLYRGETLFVPVLDENESADTTTADDAAAATPSATAEETPDEATADEALAEETAVATAETADDAQPVEDATPAAAEEPTAEATAVSGEAATSDAETTTAEGTEAPACPTTLAVIPEAIVAQLLANNGDAAALAAFLEDCGTLGQGTVANQDLTGDGIDDFVVVYTDPETSADDAGATQPRMDLLIVNSGADGYTVAHQARAESAVQLLSTVDVNNDGQADVVWTETTCGASDCFQTVQLYSWDGSAWRDWTAENVTLANAEVRLEDAIDAGQGFELLLDGGVYASAGAGPQRTRHEIWGSVDGAPYTLLDTTVDASDCLYHLVLDANAAFADGPLDDFAAAETLYTEAISDADLVACGSRENEIDELRSFSTYRLALIAAYRGEAEVAADLINSIDATYPESVYAQLGQRWLAAYQENYDIGAGCGAVNGFAADNPDATAVLADFGYANPDFTVQEICPILDIEVPTPEPTVTPEPTETPVPTETPEPTATPEPTETPVPTETPEPTATQEPTATLEPTATPEEETNSAEVAGDEVADDEVADDAAAVAESDAAESAAVSAADSGLPACPDTLAGYADSLSTVLAVAESDPLIVETWLRSCDAMDDDRGSFQLIDLNGDKVGDAIFLPTIVSDLGFGRNGAQGAVLIYHGKPDGSYELVANPEIYGEPTLLTIEDLNNDRVSDIAWSVEGCSTFCVLEVQIVTWASGVYTSTIAPGATIAEGRATFTDIAPGDPGRGKQLVLEGGVSGTADGGLAVPHTEIWQSIDRTPFQRIRWSYDRTVEGSDCLGLRLVEADVALQAGSMAGYDAAVDLYSQSIDPTLTACSLYGMAVDEELQLLQGLASFRLIQAHALNGDFVAAGEILQSLTQGQPESAYTEAATKWFAAYENGGDAAAACDEVIDIFEENEKLWQITDNYGYNHPALAAEQICFVP